MILSLDRTYPGSAIVHARNAVFLSLACEQLAKVALPGIEDEIEKIRDRLRHLAMSEQAEIRAGEIVS